MYTPTFPSAYAQYYAHIQSKRIRLARYPEGLVVIESEYVGLPHFDDGLIGIISSYFDAGDYSLKYIYGGKEFRKLCNDAISMVYDLFEKSTLLLKTTHSSKRLRMQVSNADILVDDEDVVEDVELSIIDAVVNDRQIAVAFKSEGVIRKHDKNKVCLDDCLAEPLTCDGFDCDVHWEVGDAYYARIALPHIASKQP